MNIESTVLCYVSKLLNPHLRICFLKIDFIERKGGSERETSI